MAEKDAFSPPCGALAIIGGLSRRKTELGGKATVLSFIGEKRMRERARARRARALGRTYVPCGTAPFPGLSEGRIRAAKGSHRGLGARDALLASPSCLAAFLRPLSSSLARRLLLSLARPERILLPPFLSAARLRGCFVSARLLRPKVVRILFPCASPHSIFKIFFSLFFFSTGPQELRRRRLSGSEKDKWPVNPFSGYLPPQLLL